MWNRKTPSFFSESEHPKTVALSGASTVIAMAVPGSSMRTYGAVDDPSKRSRSFYEAEDSVRAESTTEARRSLIHHVPTPPARESMPSSRRWIKAWVVGGVAFAATVAIVRSGVMMASRSTKIIDDGVSAGHSFVSAPSTGNSQSVPDTLGHQPGLQVPLKGIDVGSSADVVDDSVPLSFTANNFYTIRDGMPGQDYPWLKGKKVIEPYRETTLSVTNPRDGYNYQWEVRGGDEAADLLLTEAGSETVAIFTRMDENVITLQEVDSSGAVSRLLVETVMVKYVRREIRALTDEDRNELFDSVSVARIRIILSRSGCRRCW